MMTAHLSRLLGYYYYNKNHPVYNVSFEVTGTQRPKDATQTDTTLYIVFMTRHNTRHTELRPPPPQGLYRQPESKNTNIFGSVQPLHKISSKSLHL